MVNQVSKSEQVLLLTIAFNDAETIKLQYEQTKKYVTETFVYVVVDNSNDEQESEKIKNFCKKNTISYYRLPQMWNAISPSFSHGLALQYAYQHIVLKYKPSIVGFLDHDIFPIKQTSVQELVRGNPFFGLLQPRHGGVWYLWPGFLFFNLEILGSPKLDFTPRRGLDTGGGNYEALFKKYDVHSLPRCPHMYKTIGVNEKKKRIEFIGGWLHVMGLSGWANVKKTDIDLKEIVDMFDQKNIT